jgi:hypothetical protein
MASDMVRPIVSKPDGLVETAVIKELFYILYFMLGIHCVLSKPAPAGAGWFEQKLKTEQH